MRVHHISYICLTLYPIKEYLILTQYIHSTVFVPGKGHHIFSILIALLSAARFMDGIDIPQFMHSGLICTEMSWTAFFYLDQHCFQTKLTFQLSLMDNEIAASLYEAIRLPLSTRSLVRSVLNSNCALAVFKIFSQFPIATCCFSLSGCVLLWFSISVQECWEEGQEIETCRLCVHWLLEE